MLFRSDSEEQPNEEHRRVAQLFADLGRDADNCDIDYPTQDAFRVHFSAGCGGRIIGNGRRGGGICGRILCGKCSGCLGRGFLGGCLLFGCAQLTAAYIRNTRPRDANGFCDTPFGIERDTRPLYAGTDTDSSFAEVQLYAGGDFKTFAESHSDRKSTRLNSSHDRQSRMPSSA